MKMKMKILISKKILNKKIKKFEEIFGKLNSKKKMRNLSIGLIWFWEI